MRPKRLRDAQVERRPFKARDHAAPPAGGTMMRVDGGRLIRRYARVSHSNARRAWSEREGVILELRSGNVTGVGEASPLPGYSRDDLATCAAELARCWDRLGAVDEDAPIREVFRQAVDHSGVRAPAAVFALETALLDLVSKLRRHPAWIALRGDDRAAAIPISALAEGATPEELADAVARARARGIRVVKIKVGGPDGRKRDPVRLRAVRERVGTSTALRLDANQTLAVDGLADTLAELALFDPELIEEPAPPAELAELEGTPIAFAMDESLMTHGWRERIEAARHQRKYAAVVLKPMVLGGFERCLEIAEAARDAQLGVIVTHVFDGPIGSAAAACLALAVQGEVLPCGLDAHGRFRRPIAAIGETHILPFEADGLGIEDLSYDEDTRA